MIWTQRKRNDWYEHVLGSQRIACPNFAVDSKSGKRIYDEREVKRIYLEEGASLLRNKIDLPPPFDEKVEQPKLEPPNPLARSCTKPPPKPFQRPRWWDKMYNRQAKKISSHTWTGLMAQSDWKEIRWLLCQMGQRNRLVGMASPAIW